VNRRWVGYVMAGGVALALAGCSGGSSGSTTASSTTPVVASSTATPPPTTEASTPATPSETASASSTLPAGVDQVVTISVANGKVTPKSDRIKVKKGSTVQLVVTSDIADEVHLHGYDKHVDVEKGGTAQLTFKATISGVFEVELEAKKLRLTQLQVA
jgi:hypothetical protein